MKKNWHWLRWALSLGLLFVPLCIVIFVFVFLQSQTIAVSTTENEATKFVEWETLQFLPTEQQQQTLQAWEAYKNDLAKTQESNSNIQFTPIPSFTANAILTPTAFATNSIASPKEALIYLVKHDHVESYQLAIGENLLRQKVEVSLSKYIPITTPIPVEMLYATDIANDNGFQGIYPSPNGRYWILLKPSGFFSVPIVYDTQTKNSWLLYQEYDGITSDGPDGNFLGWHPNSQQVLFAPFLGGFTLIDVLSGEQVLLSPRDSVTSWPTGFIFPSGQNVLYSSQSNLQKVSVLGGASQLLPLVGDILSSKINAQGYFLFRNSHFNEKTPRYQLVHLETLASIPLEFGRDIWWAEFNSNQDSYFLEVENREKQLNNKCFPPQDKPQPTLSVEDTIELQLAHCGYLGREIWIAQGANQSPEYLVDGTTPKRSLDGKYLAYCSLHNGQVLLQIMEIETKTIRISHILTDEVCKFSWGEHETD